MKTFNPKRILLPASLMLLLTATSLSAQTTFTRITEGEVVNSGGFSRGANFVDTNNDGYPDIFITNSANTAELDQYYINNGDGTFTRITDDPIVSLALNSDNSSWGDYDNDGDLDVVIATWVNQLNLFYENDGNGNFTRNTEAPFATINSYTDFVAWADIDNDGWLDIYVGRGFSFLKNLVYGNDGDGTFSSLDLGALTTDEFRSHGVGWADYDNDNDLDLYITNVAADNNFYVNQGDGTFQKITGGPHVTDGLWSLRCVWGDYDNDLDLDLFVTNANGNVNRLYQNNGDGTFTTQSGNAASQSSGFSQSASFADFDNDGDLDLFVGNAFQSGGNLNYLYWNDGAGNYTRDLASIVATEVGWSMGCSAADMDRDGDLDLLVGKVRNSNEDNALFENNGNSNHWLAITCTGESGDPFSIGARIEIKATIGGAPKWQMRELTSPTAMGQNGLVGHFGLGDATVVDSVVVRWPSGNTRVLTNVDVDQYLSILEGEDLDGDGLGLFDNCPTTPNPNQVDFDNDGVGDACCCTGITGNTDGDPGDVVDIGDLTYVINSLFAGGPPAGCPDEANADGDPDAIVDIGDLTRLIGFLFSGGEPPVDCP